MDRAIRTWVLIATLAASTATAETRPRITVLLYNYAAVSPQTLASAERETAAIYGRMGIEVEWADGPTVAQGATTAYRVAAGPDRLEVRLLPHRMAERLKLRSNEVGRAMLAGDGAFGTVADIYTDRLSELIAQRNWAFGLILGNLAAHELGHLLLGPGAHTPSGIMRTGWGETDVGRALQRQMSFTPRQAEQIRNQVFARIANNPSSPVNALMANVRLLPNSPSR